MKWILLLLMLVSTANADVTRKMKTISKSFGEFEASHSSYYTSDKSADESTTKWTKGMMKTMTGGKDIKASNITRLDKELIWDVDLKEKTYKEMTFAEFRDMWNKTKSEMRDAKPEQDKADSVKEDMYEWKTEDKSDSNPKTIHGWSCRNLNIVATGINKHDPQDKVIITLNTWNSTEVPGADEVRAFHEKYAKALGLDFEGMRSEVSQLMVLYEKQMNAVIEAGKKAPGEPVTSLFEVRRNQLEGPSVGDAMKEGAMSELTGKLPFGKKKEPTKTEPKYVETVKMSADTELLEASTGTVDASKFEVPAGYKLKKK